MATEIIFPRVDMDMRAGRVGRWLVTDGERVRQGEPLFEIETDKAAMEIEAPASGTLRGVAAQEGEDVEVGRTLGWIVADGETWEQAARAASADPPRSGSASEPTPRSLPEPPAPPAPAPEPVVAAQSKEGLRATPLARREARLHGVDLLTVTGSGPQGRIRGCDVRASLNASPVTGGLHREWAGLKAGTPIVLLHGFGAEIASWRAVRTTLERGHRLLSLDLPGHGKSAPCQPGFASLVEQVIGVLVEEGVSSAHLVGHSLGGALALALTERREIEARSVVLLAPAGLGPEIDITFVRGFLNARHEASMSAWLRRLFADPAHVTASLVASVLRGRTDQSRLFQQALADALFVDGTQAIWMRDVLDRLQIPAKLIWGRHDRIIPSSHCHGVPGQIAVHLTDAGHEPHVEAASVVARLIGETARAGS